MRYTLVRISEAEFERRLAYSSNYLGIVMGRVRRLDLGLLTVAFNLLFLFFEFLAWQTTSSILLPLRLHYLLVSHILFPHPPIPLSSVNVGETHRSSCDNLSQYRHYVFLTVLNWGHFVTSSCSRRLSRTRIVQLHGGYASMGVVTSTFQYPVCPAERG